MPMRWRWPPERRMPRSPTWVLYFLGQLSMMSAICACCAACLTRVWSTFDFGTTKGMFTSMVLSAIHSTKDFNLRHHVMRMLGAQEQAKTPRAKLAVCIQ